MSVPGYAQGIQTSFLAASTHASTKPADTADTTDDGFSFGDLLDVINPLQHIPIVSTLYRHITGDTIKPLEQVAGDMLFGGVTGLVSSVADYGFQKITGKNFGDTVLAFLTGDDNSTPTAVASAAPAQIAPDQATHAPTPLLGAQIAQASPETSGSSSLLDAAARAGISSDVALRALSAYQSSLLLPKLADASVP